jgi:N-acetylglutamate synthase-like GNAT family acetyltransferase
MHIRESTEQDFPAIVDLLKKSLGETSSPKSVNFWIWKHLKNPFGPSKVLLAESDGQLIGVRAMMQWKWQQENQFFSTLRAVDTAIHPDFQGKGIFSVLTQKMVDRSNIDGVDFIFNTPNEKSLLGYLKLGWVSLGKLSVGFSYFNPLFITHQQRIILGTNLDKIDSLCNRWNVIHQKNTPLFTPKSLDYLKWRYFDNPIIKYHIYADENIFLALYCRKKKQIHELRIAEIICVDSSKGVSKKVKNLIRHYADELKANLITFAPGIKSFIPGIKILLPLGPTLAAKKVNVELPVFVNLKFAYNLGDMELF